MNKFLGIALAINVLLWIFVAHTKQERIDDCIKELDAFKTYYDSAELLLNTDSTDFTFENIRNSYESARDNVINIYNENHPNELGLNQKIVTK